ncbi:unnamed protein product [Clonostachys byssicola]|uniref:Uncharacterized protein n=1 Tax=Clonostachys byssicola TaxID=160290 RepID=A0A9N9UN77_9HYPO|nr:unnamed protein product [Clonostachys byssicola]
MLARIRFYESSLPERGAHKLHLGLGFPTLPKNPKPVLTIVPPLPNIPANTARSHGRGSRLPIVNVDDDIAQRPGHMAFTLTVISHCGHTTTKDAPLTPF